MIDYEKLKIAHDMAQLWVDKNKKSKGSDL